MRRITSHSFGSFGSFGFLFISLAIAGCFQSQDVLSTQDAGAAPPDTGPAWNGGPPPTVDAALPPIDEPDVGPDEQPSDDPGAGAWIDPPPASSNPCCDLGELVGLGDPTHQSHPPVVAWGGDAWGLAWAEMSAPADDPSEPDHALFAELDADARPIAPPASVWGLGFPTALAYESGRYAIATREPGRTPDSTSYVGVLHPSGALVDFVVVDNPVVDVVRYPAAHAWVALVARSSLRRYDDALDPVGAPVELSENVGLYAELVALKSRLVAVLPTSDGVMHATFTGSELEPVSTGLLVRPGTYTSSGGNEERGVASAATAMRDTVVAIAMDATDVWSVVYDPFRDAVVSGPMRIARSPADRGHDVAGDHEGGTIGVCYPDGDGPYGGYRDGTPQVPHRIQFLLLGPDGAPLGTPVTIAEAPDVWPVHCAVAAAGRDHYVVAFWQNGGGPEHPIYARRVDVRR